MKVWPFMPQVGPTDTLEWLTDLIETKGSDQRLALRQYPRLSVQYSFIQTPSQFSREKALAKALSAEEVLVPLWVDLLEAGDLSFGQTLLAVDPGVGRYREGSQVLIWESDTLFEAATVESLAGANILLTTGLARAYSRAIVCPLVPGRFATPFTATRSNREDVTATASFAVTENINYPAEDVGTLYRGFPVLTDRTILVSPSVRETFEREKTLVDYQLGLSVMISDRTAPVQTSSVTWDPLNKADRDAVVRWLHARKGKYGSFWLPSWNGDFKPVAPLVIGETTLTIEKRLYSDVLGLQDLIFILENGDIKFLRANSWGVSGLNEVANLDAPAAFGFTLDQVVYSGFVTLMRFNSDRIEIKYRNAGGASIVVPVTEVLGE